MPVFRVWKLAPLCALGLVCCQGNIGDGGNQPVDPDAGDQETLTLELEGAVLPRLTNAQYRNAVVDLLGEGLPEPSLEADTNPYLFFSIGAASTSLSELGVQQLEEAADELTAFVFSDPDRRLALVGCEAGKPPDTCTEHFILNFGRRAYRRPLTGAEVDRWTQVASDLSDGDPWLGLQMAVAGILQSPSFVYRVELGEPDPEDDSRFRYTSWEMASRLSFTLHNTTPDDELLEAAASASLLTAEGVETQARRLIQGERARASIQEFFAQYFDLTRLNGLTRSETNYPLFSEYMPKSMRTEVKLLRG